MDHSNKSVSLSGIDPFITSSGSVIFLTGANIIEVENP